MKRFLSGLMVLVMAITMLSTVALASEVEEKSKIGQIPTVIGTVQEGVSIVGYIENADGEGKAPIQQDRLKLFGIDYANMKYVDNKAAADEIKEMYALLNSADFKPETLYADLGTYVAETYDYHAGANAFVAKEMFYIEMPDASLSEMLNAENTTFSMDMLTEYTDDNDVLVALMKIDGDWKPVDIKNTGAQTTTLTIPQEGVVVILRADKMAKGAVAGNGDNDITGPALISIAVVCVLFFIATLVFKKKPAVAEGTAKENKKEEKSKPVKSEQPKNKKLSSDGYYDDDDDDDD